jgi:hypothetical protein
VVDDPFSQFIPFTEIPVLSAGIQNGRRTSAYLP